jgi:HEAT repeat protein
MTNLLLMLRGGDRRSIGRADEVAALVSKDPSLFGELFDGMLADDPIVRMRAADAVEKVTAERPDLLQPYKRKLIGRVARIDQQEVRWHFAQIAPRLDWTDKQRSRVIDILLSYMEDESAIVRTFSLQALVDLAGDDATRLRRKAIKLCEEALETGPKSMQSRARKLLTKFRQH